MQGTSIIHTVHVPGTLAANVTYTFTAYRNMTLQHISAVASNNSDATLIVGVSSDTDSILESTTIGDSGTPAEKTAANWSAVNPTGAISDGDVVVVTLDYDGAAGTAAQDVTLVLTFTEG